MSPRLSNIRIIGHRRSKVCRISAAGAAFRQLLDNLSAIAGKLRISPESQGQGPGRVATTFPQPLGDFVLVV